ncbi:hypothetical protein E4T66_10300 [Sinimarinibacterium sp. CAU 1509]|nr:hypothetical protein E4T66_10300 [Sinimarinibacterium sp. CAU 1509]
MFLIVAMLNLSGCASTSMLRPFTTDACSLFPDGDAEDASRWSECCVAHDQLYWRGGTATQRRHADVALRDCVLAHTGRQHLADLMFRGVRIGGSPLLPTPFRWGYGWRYGRGYAPLTPDEQRMADEKHAEYSLKRSEAACTPPSE